MKECALEAIAERQWRDYQARTPGTYFAEQNSSCLDLMQAYAIQRAVAAIRLAAGETLVGYKVGCPVRHGRPDPRPPVRQRSVSLRCSA